MFLAASITEVMLRFIDQAAEAGLELRERIAVGASMGAVETEPSILIEEVARAGYTASVADEVGVAITIRGTSRVVVLALILVIHIITTGTANQRL